MSEPAPDSPDELGLLLNNMLFEHTDYFEDGSGTHTHWAIETEDLPKLLTAHNQAVAEAVREELLWHRGLAKERYLANPERNQDATTTARVIDERIAALEGEQVKGGDDGK